MKNSIFILFFLHLALFGFTQDKVTNELICEVNTIYPPLSMSKEKLKEAQSLADLHRFYKSSWVKEYISVEVAASYNGEIQKIMGENDILTPKQKDLMNKADVGTEIAIKMLYMPDNTLTHNDIKVFDFKFMVNPEHGATYASGQQPLNQYLKDNVMAKIPDGIFQGYDLAIVKFTINEEGEVTEPHIFWTSKDEKIDELLVETVSKMPCWKPAEYANGVKVKQEFALMVGNKENCAVNMLNIEQD